jgi:hypothetical protein
MTIAKSLLLGTAASLVAVATAQAADLPVKAKPVEYVKVCSLYGAGFFYIPGTDTCIKLGGAVRVQAEFNAGAGGIPVGLGSGAEIGQGSLDRSNTNDTNFRTRIYFSVDARQQTEYGTLRSYFRFGVQQTTPTDAPPNGGAGTSVFWDRAFIQFAGFTVGRTVSFYDGVTWADFNYNNPRTTFDSGANGITVWAYTAQFGNGISASISAEDPNGRFKRVLESPAFGVGSNLNDFLANGLAGQSATNNGMLFPDVVGNLRVDQAWGSAQVMAAMHDVSGSYYGGSILNGHPDNAFGWALGGAFSINLPSFGATSNVNSQPNVDQLRFSASYTQGAVGYVTNENNASFLNNGSSSLGFANLFDGAYLFNRPTAGNTTQVKLTTAWSAYGGYQHLWTPNWRTSVYGGYLKVEPDGSVQANACRAAIFGLPATTNFGSCLSWSTWQVGSRTQWNPVSQLDIGVDVLYSKLNTELAGSNLTPNTTGCSGCQSAKQSFADQDVWSVMFRVQRNFWP